MEAAEGSMYFGLSDAPGGKAVEAMKSAAVAVAEMATVSNVSEAKRSKGIIAFTADMADADAATLKKVRDAIVGVLKDAEVPGRLAAKRP